MPDPSAACWPGDDDRHGVAPTVKAENASLFADRAKILAGWAGLALGWRAPCFWEATPEELAGVIEAARGGDVAATATPMDMSGLNSLRVRFPDG